MIPSVAAISQQYAQFAPRARCRCCRWPRVCVWSRSINAGSASARIQWTCKMCSNNIPISLAISSHLSVNNIINTITSVLTKYAANITQPHTGSKTSFNPKTKFQRCDKNENVVKLREREGQGVDPGRSLKGHLWMVDGGWWYTFP